MKDPSAPARLICRCGNCVKRVEHVILLELQGERKVLIQEDFHPGFRPPGVDAPPRGPRIGERRKSARERANTPRRVRLWRTPRQVLRGPSLYQYAFPRCRAFQSGFSRPSKCPGTLPLFPPTLGAGWGLELLGESLLPPEPWLSSVVAQVIKATRQVADQPEQHIHRSRLNVPAGFPARHGISANAQQPDEISLRQTVAFADRSDFICRQATHVSFGKSRSRLRAAAWRLETAEQSHRILDKPGEERKAPRPLRR